MEYVLDLLRERHVQVGLIVGLAGVYLLSKLLRKSKDNLPPGPKSWPLLGHLFSLSTTEETNKNFAKWRKEYGDIFTVYLGQTPWVVLTTPDLVREAFLTKGHDFDGRIELPSMDMFTEGGKDIAFAQPGPVWKLQRQIAHSAIRKHASGQNLERNMESAVESFIKSVERQSDGIVDIPKEMMRMTYNFLASVCFGRQFDLDDPWLGNFQRIFEETGREMGSGFYSDFIPAFKIFEKGKVNALSRLTDEYYKLIGGEMDAHEKSFDPDHSRDLTDEILQQLRKQKESSQENPVLAQLEKAHLRQVLSDVFSGGTDTSRVTLAIIIGYLVKYPEVQAKLHKELDDVLGESGRVTLKSKDLLPYTNAVVHEAMRIDTVVPVGVPHMTTKDTALGKYKIPKGTVVAAHVHGIHRDPDNFPNPDAFHPDRWIDEHGKFQYKPYKFIPFSMGPRVCLGEALARINLLMFTAMLFQKYEFHKIDEKPFTVQLRDFQFGVETAPYKLKLKERY